MKKLINLTLMLALVGTLVTSSCGGDDRNPNDPVINPDYTVTTIGLVTSGETRYFRGRLDKIPVGERVQAGFTYWEPDGREHRFEDVASLTATGTWELEFGLPFSGPQYTVRAFVITRAGDEIRGKSEPFPD